MKTPHSNTDYKINSMTELLTTKIAESLKRVDKLQTEYHTVLNEGLDTAEIRDELKEAIRELNRYLDKASSFSAQVLHYITVNR